MKGRKFFLITITLAFLFSGLIFGLGVFLNLAYGQITCQDECQPRGQLQCFDNINNQICDSFYDADPCLEWSPLQSCLADTSCGYQDCQNNERPRWYCEVKTGECEYICEDDPSCRGATDGAGEDECSYQGQTQCADSTHKQLCGYYDTDPYLDWSSPQSCVLDTSCGYGTCIDSQKPSWQCSGGWCIYDCLDDQSCGAPSGPSGPIEPCQDECPKRWQTQCVGDNRVQVCGYHYDDDPCLEWYPSKSCNLSNDCGYGECQNNQRPTNWHCQQGECNYDCTDDETCPEELPPDYLKHHRKGCYDNDVYWFDSNGVLQDKEKECSDDNEATIDGCQEGECFNTIYEIGSPFYCQNYEHCGDGICNCEEDLYTCFEDCEFLNLEVSLWGRKEAEEEWKEDIVGATKENIDIQLVVKNDSQEDFDNVIVRSALPEEIIYKGDLKIENIPFDGNVKDGVNIGFLSSGSEKKITFKGEISSKAVVGEEIEIRGTAETEGLSFSDSMNLTIEKARRNILLWLISKWYIWLLLWIGFVALLYWILKRSSE